MRKFIIRACKSIISRLTPPVATQPDRDSFEGALSHIKNLGFNPGTVIDIGAASGTPCLYHVFPEAKHFAIDPLIENEGALELLKLKFNLSYIITAVGSYEGKIKFNVHTDHLDGSSLFKEQRPEFDGIEREVPIRTLDKICLDSNLRGPYLLKIDTQGSELEILKGASDVLKQTEYIILEASFFVFYKSQPIIHDIVIFLKDQGFTLYDICDVGYRPLDGACAQVDLVFVKNDGLFRASNDFSTIDQWESR